MHNLYSLVSGPLLWFSVIVCVGGLLYRFGSLIYRAYRNEPFIFHYFNLRYGLRSIFRWSTPFATTNMRKRPVMTVVTFLFHVSLLALPVFVLAHVVLFEEAWGAAWWTLPHGLAELMTKIVIAGCVFFLIRRIVLPEVRFVTTPSDYAILLIVALPFVTGFWAGHRFPGYSAMTIAHMITGEILLIAIPFTRLRHMLYAVFTRFYMGSEFGGVRKARDW